MMQLSFLHRCAISIWICHITYTTTSLISFKQAGCDYGTTTQNLNATYIIGALFPIHEQDTVSSKFRLNVFGVTWVEAFLFAIDEINKEDTLLPGVTLGYDVRDTCNSQRVAKQHTLDLMTDSKFFLPVNSTTRNGAVCRCFEDKESRMLGVVGGARSRISSVCSYLLSASHIPQISYASTSPSLSNKFVYPNFLRTLPSDLQQTYAVTELLHHIASDDEYGRLAIQLLQKNFKKKGICLAVQKQFNPSLPADELKEIVDALEAMYTKSQIAILWTSDYTSIRKIVNECKSRGLNNMLWAVLTEIWGTEKNLGNFKDQRMIRLSYDNSKVTNFIGHLDRLEYQSHLNNPWMRPLWNAIGFCPEFGIRNSSLNYTCIPQKPTGQYLPKNYHETVISSVYAFAHGLHHMLNCTRARCATKTNLDYRKLLESIKRSGNQFHIPFSDMFVQFDQNGDNTASSYKFQLYGKKVVDFGYWDGKNEKTHFSSTTFWDNYGRNHSTNKPCATCSRSCNPGSYMIKHHSKPCCWTCVDCPSNRVSSRMDALKCEKCDFLEVPNNYRNQCMPLKNKHFSVASADDLIIGALSLVGIVLASSVLVVFILYWNTPVVKSANREMSIIQISCLVSLFFLPIIDLFPVSRTTCVMQTVLFGSLHSLILAFILLKTYRLWKLFQPAFFATRLKIFLRVPVQVLLSLLFVVVLLLALGLWYGVHKPGKTLYTNPLEMGYIYHCGEQEDYLLYALVLYIILLSLASGFIAFHARSLPANFNEAQYIWLAMFANCIAWIVFFPLHMSANELHQPRVVLSVNLASTFIILCILYGGKLHMLLCLSHKNNRLYFTGLATNASVKTFTLKLKREESSPTGPESPPSTKKSKNRKNILVEKNRVISFSFDST